MIGRQPASEPTWAQGAAAAADLGSFAIHADTRTVRLDARAAEMVGLAADRELALDEYVAAIDPSARDAWLRHVSAALDSAADAYHDEFRTTARRWIAADGRTRRDRPGGQARLLGVMADVTLRRTTEDARSRLVDEMARALRFNDMLIGVVAHDLRNPLAAIAMSATSTRVTRSAARMSRIVDQLLELTRGRLDGQIPLRLATTDLAALARDVTAELTASRTVTVASDARGDTSCGCDPERVAQILSNLLGNALHHSTDVAGVRVTIDGTAAGSVAITVTNPGTIAARQLPTLFNPFVRLGADRSPRDHDHGLGLGLYIARRIALGHGGDITCSSSGGHTAFRVDLPRVATTSGFSLTPERADEEQVSLERLASSIQSSTVTAAMFGVLPIEERAPEVFASLVDRHARLLELSLAREIYRDARMNLASELRDLAEQLGGLGGGASDVAELHSQALKRAIKGAPAMKVQALVNEGRLLALELMGRLLTYYRKRSGFGSLARNRAETTP